MTVSKVSEYSYLIIGGTTKAATTSLFAYLADHPQICAANVKETRFFLDKDYPVPSKYRLEDGLEKYETFYCHCPKLRMEATPDYLYSLSTPQNIKQYLPYAKMVFILRHPVSRIISWYRFAKQIGRLSDQITFDEYIKQQIIGKDRGHIEQHMLALEQGRYSYYLKRYLEVFGREDICVLFYEEILEDPRKALDLICRFSGIKCDFYENYNFYILNRTETMRNAHIHKMYIRFRYNVRRYTHNKSYIRMSLRRLRLLIEPFYFKINVKNMEQVEMSQNTKIYLDQYFRDESSILSDLIGRKVPWI